MGADQKTFDALIRTAIQLLQDERADGIVLAASDNGNGGCEVHFGGNATKEMAAAFGDGLGTAMAQDPHLGIAIGVGIKHGASTEIAKRSKSESPLEAEPATTTKH